MKSMKSMRYVLLACATVATLGYALNAFTASEQGAEANAPTMAECRNEFGRSEASNTCKVIWTGAPEKWGGQWQCPLQFRCAGKVGTSATVKSAYEYDRLDELVNCGDGAVAYSGDCLPLPERGD